MASKDILVCPVAYNENVKLKKAIDRFLETGLIDQVDYLIVDDASTDGTTDMIRGFADRGVQTIVHETRSGVGAAIRTAIRHARQEGYRIIVIMAGNDKDDPREIMHLVDPVERDGYDLVQGSRYLHGERVGGDMPLYRKWATRLHPWLMSLITRRKITDSTNGFRAIRLEIFQDPRIRLDQDWLNGYELEPYILYQVLTLGLKYREVAVTKIYPPKKLGYTKMKPVVGWWSILRPLFYLGLGIKR